MRMVYKSQFGTACMLILVASAFSASEANAASPHLISIKAKLDKVKDKSVTCSNQAIYAGNAAARAACTGQCRPSVDKWRKEAPEKVKAAFVSDNSVTATNQTKGVAAVGKVENQVSSAINQKEQLAAAETAMGQRNGINRQLASELKQCADEIHNSCKNIAPEDAKIASDLISACEDSKALASGAAGQNKADGLGLGDLGKGMDLATKALGLGAAAMQMANAGQTGQNAGSDPATMGGLSGATAPTPSSLNNSGPETADLGTGTTSGSPVVAFGNLPGGQTIGASTTGSGVAATTGSSGSAGDRAYGSSGYGNGSVGSPEVGAVGAAGSGAAGGSSDSSGASRPGKGSAAGDGAGSASAGSGYEVNMGGGKAMLGMKASKGDLDDLTGPITDPVSTGEDLGNMRQLASFDDSQASEQQLDSAESIFQRIKIKYATLKEKGKF